MFTTRHHAGNVLVIAASNRTGSIHQALARQITDRLAETTSVDRVDLRDYEMPLYDGDHETRQGVPSAAAALAARLSSAAVLIIVSPEYNGTFTPLLKNTVDWVTRVDAAALAHLRVLIASASPGRGGGANGVAMVRTWLSNMGIDAAGSSLSVGGASLGADGRVVGLDHDELMRFLQQATAQRFAA